VAADVDELALAETLIAHDTSTADGVRDAMGFIAGWLDGHGVEHRESDVNGLPTLVATVGEGPATVLWSAHVDVVPGSPDQFQPRRDDGLLFGRGAYDMKGALAAMLAALADLEARPKPTRSACAKLVLVADEESDSKPLHAKATARLVAAGHVGDFVICGEPTDLQIGVQAKGALVLRLDVRGRSAHGSMPALGRNAVLEAIDIYHRVERLPFMSARSQLFDPPTVNLGRIAGGDAVNRVPDRCTLVLDVRILPGQDPDEVVAQVRSLGPPVEVLYQVPAADLDPRHPGVHLLRRVVHGHRQGRALSVGRAGASDAVLFLERGIPSVEFGPTGADHHGPDEHVEIASLAVYRRVLTEFVEAAADIGPA
jgi:succinyl-diaminopimelate desuccinylase